MGGMDISAGDLIASLVIGTIGFSLFLYGKKQQRAPQLVTGGLMMAFPYFGMGALWVWGIGAALVGGLWAALRSGL